jgi:hypothetical protein
MEKPEKKPAEAKREPPFAALLQKFRSHGLLGGVFTLVLTTCVAALICFYTMALVSASVSVSFEGLGQTRRLVQPLEVSFTCQSPKGCLLFSQKANGESESLQSVDGRSMVQVQLPFAVSARIDAQSSTVRSGGEGVFASVVGTYGDAIDLVHYGQSSNRSRPSSTKLLPTLKRTLRGAVAATFVADDSQCLAQEINLCDKFQGSAPCNVVCASSTYFRVAEQQVPSYSLLLGQVGALIALVLLITVRFYAALHASGQNRLKGCGDDKDLSPDSITIEVPCVQATWSSTWQSGMQSVMAFDDGPRKVRMQRDPDEADFSVPAEDARSQTVTAASARMSPGMTMRSPGLAMRGISQDSQRDSLIDRADVTMVRQRIEDLLGQVNQSNSAQPEIMHVRDRVTAMLHSTQAVEARMSPTTTSRSPQPPANQFPYSPQPYQPSPATEIGQPYLSPREPLQQQPPQPSGVAAAVLPPGIQASMQYRLESLKVQSGLNPASQFDTGFWQRLEALEAEALMLERLERMEKEQEEIRNIHGDHRVDGTALPLRERVELMESELHNRCDRNETELREQRLALKVFDAGFRHRLDALDQGMKQHRNFLERVTQIESQVRNLHSFEQEFVKKLNTVHDQLERWAANST